MLSRNNVVSTADDPSLYIGMMSGTSLDALDAVLCQFDGDNIVLLGTQSVPFETNLRQVLLALCQPDGVHQLSDALKDSLDVRQRVAPVSELDWAGWASVAYASFASQVVHQLLATTKVDASSVTAIGCHGQTVRHRYGLAFTMQLVDPNVLAENTGINVVTDFRRRDMAVGGQGAPLAPAFHAARFTKNDTNRVVVNLGGIANITLLPAAAKSNPADIIGFDTGPASNLLDAWYQHHVEQGTVDEFMHTDLYDTDGNWAKTGSVNTALLTQLMTHPYLQLPAPKSTGREDFNLAWLQQQLAVMSRPIAPADVQATLTAFTVQTLTTAIVTETQKRAMAVGDIILCGGGAYNTHLLRQLAIALPDWHILTSEKLGMAPTWIESMAFAWLARQTLLGLTGNLPSVTGAAKTVRLGQICFA